MEGVFRQGEGRGTKVCTAANVASSGIDNFGVASYFSGIDNFGACLQREDDGAEGDNSDGGDRPTLRARLLAELNPVAANAAERNLPEARVLLGRIERPQGDDDGVATPPPPERRRRGKQATCCVTTKFVAIAIQLLLVVAIDGPPCQDLSGGNAAAAAGDADADGTRNDYIEAFILTKIRSRAPS